MKGGKNINLLFQYAHKYRFDEFDKLFLQAKDSFSSEELSEAYLMRAQIKLYMCDLSAFDDLNAVSENKPPIFQALGTLWTGDAPNLFIVFPRSKGSIKEFLKKLPAAGEKLFRLFGDSGDIFVSQLQCEINYFLGNLKEALSLSKQRAAVNNKNNAYGMLSLILQYRCYLALGQPDKADECMLSIVRYSKTYPECVDIYTPFRGWANLTTSWHGDSRRFFEDKSGALQPDLNDRVEHVTKLNAAQTRPMEAPFIQHAQRSYKDSYTLRQHYMDIFHAMYWLSIDDTEQAKMYFEKAYLMAEDTGIIMPFIECGEQLMPLIDFVRDNHGIEFSKKWLDYIVTKARDYERCLRLYQ